MNKEEMDLAAKEWVFKFARSLPGMFDHSEGVKCWLAGASSVQERCGEIKSAIRALEDTLRLCAGALKESQAERDLLQRRLDLVLRNSMQEEEDLNEAHALNDSLQRRLDESVRHLEEQNQWVKEVLEAESDYNEEQRKFHGLKPGESLINGRFNINAAMYALSHCAERADKFLRQLRGDVS